VEEVARVSKVHHEDSDEQEGEQEHRDSTRIAAIDWRSGTHGSDGVAADTMIAIEKSHP
jgi:hypothetical protein